MAYVPISRFPFQYFKLDGNPANGYYLKFYQANSATPINMQTDAGGATSLAKCKLNEYGFPISNPNDNSTVFIPHLSTTYTTFRFVLYASAADADANNVTSGLPNVQSIGNTYDPESDLATSVKMVGTFAALVNTTANVGDVVITKCHTTPGYGGQTYDVISSGGVTADTGFYAINGAIAFKSRAVNLQATPYMFGYSPTSTAAEQTTILQAMLNASKNIDLCENTYTPNAQLTATVDHQIRGRGFNKTFINPTHTNPAIYIPTPASDLKVSLLLDQFTITAKNGIKIGGDRTSHSTDFAIIGGYINVCVVGTYGAGSGDAAYDSDEVRDTGNTLVSSNTGTSLSTRKTYDDISAYGVGLQLCKCIDTVIDFPQFYGNGVSVSLIGCDLIKWRGGRSHEVGTFLYSERVGTWGSQLKIYGTDLLHNRRAGGIILNGTKFDRVEDTYYECYSTSALVVFSEGTEGFVYQEDNRVDDPYYTGGGGTSTQTTPLMVFADPRWSNLIRGVMFQKFSSFSVAIPSVRVLGNFSSIDSNHPEAVAIVPLIGYAPVRFKAQNPGCRFGELIRNIYTPTNIPLAIGGNISSVGVADGNKFVFYDASAATCTARFDIAPLQTAYTLSVNCKVTSGTTLFATVEHHRFDGTLASTPFSGAFGVYTTTAYANSTQALTLTQEPQVGDYLLFVWTANSARISAIEIK